MDTCILIPTGELPWGSAYLLRIYDDSTIIKFRVLAEKKLNKIEKEYLRIKDSITNTFLEKADPKAISKKLEDESRLRKQWLLYSDQLDSFIYSSSFLIYERFNNPEIVSCPLDCKWLKDFSTSDIIYIREKVS